MLRAVLAVAFLATAQGLLIAPLAKRPPTRTVAPLMGYEETAAECIEEGCPVDTVEILLDELKAEKNPSAAMMKTINKLERLLASPNVNSRKGELEKLVAAAARSFSIVDRFNFPGEPLGYTGKEGTTTTAGKALDLD